MPPKGGGKEGRKTICLSCVLYHVGNVVWIEINKRNKEDPISQTEVAVAQLVGVLAAFWACLCN